MFAGHRTVFVVLFAALAFLAAAAARADVEVRPTTDPDDLAAALNESGGLSITDVSIVAGVPGQFGTYANFTTAPITIEDGIILSSGHVSYVGPPADPILDYPQPSWDMQAPGTPEFDAYGPNHIENFYGSYDVAALRVDFELEEDSQVQFDFVFGSVEFPYWTSAYTDSFIVFLDGTAPENQITFDRNGNPVQVGVSFAGLVSTDDQNTAFADPHGLLRKLITTTAELPAGPHTLWFEVGDVNDHILDSAVFIANLRTGHGDEGTEPEHGDVNRDGSIDGLDIQAFIDVLYGYDDDADHRIAADMNDDGTVDTQDVYGFVECLVIHDC